MQEHHAVRRVVEDGAAEHREQSVAHEDARRARGVADPVLFHVHTRPVLDVDASTAAA